MERAPCEVFTSGTLVDPELLQGVSPVELGGAVAEEKRGRDR